MFQIPFNVSEDMCTIPKVLALELSIFLQAIKGRRHCFVLISYYYVRESAHYIRKTFKQLIESLFGFLVD